MKKFTSFETQLGESVVLTDKAKLSLYKKSQNSGYSIDILEEVYRRGYNCWNEQFGNNPDQFAFERVNSFIAGGFAVELDEDLKKACWKGYEAIGMKMKNGKKVPNCVPVKEDDAEKHSTNPDDPASRFIGSDELVAVYKKETPGQTVKRVVKEATYKGKTVPLNKPMKGDVKKSKVFVDPDGDGKAKKVNFGDKSLSIKKHIPARKKSYCARSGGQGNLTDKTSANYWSRKAWNCEETIHEAGMQAATAPAPTAADMGPKRLSRYQATQQTSTMGNQGLNRSGPMGTRISTSSPTTPRGLRSMTSGSTQATAKTLTPQRVSANQPAPKTASAPASAPKPSASFGSSSRPTTASATSSGMQKSPGFNLSSGMSDAGKAKVKPTAPVQIPAGASKVASTLGKVARFAGPVGAVAGLVADAKPLNAGEDELGRQKSLGISKPNVTPGMGSTKNIEPVKGGSITTKAPEYYKGQVGDYTVKAGDTLSGIAAKTGQSVADLASKNKFDSENKIAAGAKLFTGDVPTAPKRPETESGGKKK